MGRTKTFNERDVLQRCAETFTTYGYEGTSIDQLVSSTGLLRGSIYSAFGSKRGLFLATLKEACADSRLTDQKLDLCLVALMELASVDNEVRDLVEHILTQLSDQDRASILGSRLLTRAAIPHSLNKGE